MANEKELRFVVFLIHALASAWGRSPAVVYAKLMESGILNKYIIPSYDMLHTLGREYLVEDITECMQEWGYQI